MFVLINLSSGIKFYTKNYISRTATALYYLHNIYGTAWRSWRSGSKEYRYEGKAHNEHGPAFIWSNGKQAYFLNGRRYEYEDWLIETKNNGTKKCL